MTAIEILLLIIGGVIFIVSFFIPQKKDEASGVETFSREQVRQLLADEMKEAKGNMRDMVDETVTYSVEKAERAMERLTNEKLSAVSEFSDTVLSDINKNRDEVMFLYDMLNDKHENLKEAAREIHLTTKEARRANEELRGILQSKADETGDAPRQEAEEPSKTGQAEGSFVPFGSLMVEKIDPQSIPVRKSPEKQADIVHSATHKGEKAKASKHTKKQTSDEDVASKESTFVSFDGNIASQGNNNEKILELHRMNKSNVAIAKELGLGVGEVKLVIDLYKGM